MAVQQELDGYIQGLGDPGEIAGELAGPIRFPLSDGAAGDACGGRELGLAEPALPPQEGDALADCGVNEWFRHWAFL